MKQFHEAAVIKNGITEAYFVQDTQGIKDAADTKVIASLPYKKVDAKEFEQLVRSDMVQYLVWENNSASCRITDEERNILLNSKVKRDLLHDMEQNYWQKDAAFSSLHITLADVAGALAVSACNIVSLAGIKFMLFCAYGSEGTVSEVLSHEDLFNKMGASITVKSTNHFSFCVPVIKHVFVNFLTALAEIAVPLVCTDPVRYSLIGKNIKAGPFVKAIGGQKYIQYVEALDNFTATHLNIIARLQTANAASEVPKDVEKTSCFG